MTPQELIESQVPTILNEREHKWGRLLLAGCPTCESHDGFQCSLCGRCVDMELDTELYNAIEILVVQEESRGD